jgi:hypothetical protein
MKVNKYIYGLVATLALMFNACSPDDYSLGSKDISSDDLTVGTAYTITHDTSNPNIVYLHSLLPSSYTVLWDEPQGRSQDADVTLKIPFAGTYTVRMGVETRGGVVYGPSTTFTVDGFCADFVSDPLWTVLSGGVGKSKKWYLDLDKSAVCRYFVGPLYFYGTYDSWKTVTLGEKAPDGADSWSWAADWAGNGSWLFGSSFTPIDMGYMEFDLNGGANVKVVANETGKTYTGTYMLDADNHTMKLTDAPVLHDASRDAIVTKWGDVTILSMDKDHMQLAVLRDNSTEGKCLLSYNFISEDYRNNWTPKVDNTPVVPTLASDWLDYVEPTTSHEMIFKLDDTKPFDWCNLNGSQKNITSFSAVSGVEDTKLVLYKKGNTRTYSCTTPSGNVVTGTYTVSSDGIYTFSNGLPVVQLSKAGNAMFKANADKTLRVMQYSTDDYSGSLTDFWLGSQCVDDEGNLYQYLGYHFVHQQASAAAKKYTGALHFADTDWAFQTSDDVYVSGDGDYTFTINGSSEKPYLMYLDVLKILKDYPNCNITIKDIKVDGNSVSFDDTAISRGVGDEATTARRYILNPWGTKLFSDDTFKFSKSIAVTVHVTYDSGSVVMKSKKRR